MSFPTHLKPCFILFLVSVGKIGLATIASQIGEGARKNNNNIQINWSGRLSWSDKLFRNTSFNVIFNLFHLQFGGHFSVSEFHCISPRPPNLLGKTLFMHPMSFDFMKISETLSNIILCLKVKKNWIFFYRKFRGFNSQAMCIIESTGRLVFTDWTNSLDITLSH